MSTATKNRWGQPKQTGAGHVTREREESAINDASYSRLKAARADATEAMRAAVSPSVAANRPPTEDEVQAYSTAEAELKDVTAQLARIKATHTAEEALDGMDAEWQPILAASRGEGVESLRSDLGGILDVCRGHTNSHSINLTAAAASRLAWDRGARGRDFAPAVLEATAEMAPDPDQARRSLDHLLLVASHHPEALVATVDKGTSGTGAEYVPTLQGSQLFEKLLSYQGIMSANPQVIVTETGFDFDYPIWTADTDAGVTDDGADATLTEPATSEVTFKAWNFTGFFQVEENWLADVSGVINGIDDMFMSTFLRSIGRKLDKDLTTGNGTATAQGVVTGSGAGVTDAGKVPGTTPWTPENVLGLIHSIDDYFDDENLRILCKRATRQYFLLARASATADFYPFLNGDGKSVFGTPLHPGPNLVTVGANNKPAVIANLQAGYAVRFVGGGVDGGGVVITRNPVQDFRKGIVGLRAVLRGDGRFLDTACAKHLDTVA